MIIRMDGRLTVDTIIMYLVLIAFTAGCTTMQSLPATDVQSLASQIKVGDKIKIIRNGETDATFKVSAVSDEGISGEGVFVVYPDIRQVQVSKTDTVKTVGLTVGIVAVAAIVLIAQYVEKYGPGLVF